MHIDAAEIEGSERQFDLCIVGGGAAGITLARELRDTNASICLLEGGGFAPEQRSQDIYDGDAKGTVLTEKEEYLRSSRLRFLGGTTNHWRGWCRPLDPIDFEQLPWVPNSGWPILRTDLDPYYRRALEMVEISHFEYPLAEAAERSSAQILAESSAIETRLFHRSPPTRFAARYGDDLFRAGNVELLTNANVVELRTGGSERAVSEVLVKTYSGRDILVKARYFVLAAGGIENARLLLASNREWQSGLGNENDLVGRFFADHHQVPVVGYVLFTRPKQSILLYTLRTDEAFGHDTFGTFCLSEQARREHRLLAHSFFLGPPLRGGSVSEITRLLAADRSEFDAPNSSMRPSDVLVCSVRAASEQSPNPDSRVTLDEKRDPFGYPRAALDWRIPAEDNENLRRAFLLFSRELGRFGEGRGKLVISEENPWPEGCGGGSHHMGTTRMHASPKEGVVDGDCRMHAAENVYIAGSSVFPTIGYVNPTFTITALALRLAEHLKKILEA